MAGMIKFIVSEAEARQLHDALETGAGFAVLHPLNADGKPTGMTLLVGHGCEDGTLSWGFANYMKAMYGDREIPNNVKLFCCFCGKVRDLHSRSSLLWARNVAKAVIGNWKTVCRVTYERRCINTYTLVLGATE